MEVYLPQVRGGDEPFHTKLGAFLKGNTKSLRETNYRDVCSGFIYSGLEDALLEATKDWCNA